MSSDPSPGHFHILYFASAATFTRKSIEEFPAPLPVAELFSFLETKYPGINQRVLRSCAVTVNADYVDVGGNSEVDNSREIVSVTTIQEGDEVALIPPIASG